MEVTVNMSDGSERYCTLSRTVEVDMMIAALTENLPGWSSIEIVIVNNPGKRVEAN